MRVTNHHGLPAGVVQAVSYDAHGPRAADITVTELIKPPQMLELSRQHDHELTVDASDQMARLIGTAVHEYLARYGAASGELSEERLRVNMRGWWISGKFDSYSEADGGTIVDYKYTSVWSFIHGGRVEWEQQLNMYAFLLRENGWPVEHAIIVPILRDYDETRQGDEDYPPAPSFRHGVPVWPIDEQHAYMAKRVELHQNARRAKRWPPCSPTERWERPTIYAVVKEGATRATAIFGDGTERGGGLDEAQTWANAERKNGAVYRVVREGADNNKAVAVFGANTQRGGGFVEAQQFVLHRVKTGDYKVVEVAGEFNVITRRGSSIRCARYCDVGRATGVCEQWKTEQATARIEVES